MNRKKAPILAALLLITTWISPAATPARDKTEKIGKATWYTEQNDFHQVVQVAQKEKKPILAVFSATWCKPCQKMKKDVFKSAQFDQVADRVVLFYVEETAPGARRHLKRNRINVFPTLKIFSKKGVLLDIGSPKRTVAGLLAWLKDVEQGKHLHGLKQKLAKEPNNRELILEIVRKLSLAGMDERLALLRRGAKINPNLFDKLTRQINEILALHLYRGLSGLQEPRDRKAYARKHHDEFARITSAYYPDKFTGPLRGIRGLIAILTWYNALQDYGNSVAYYRDHLKARGNNIVIREDIYLFPQAFVALLHGGYEKEALGQLARLQELTREELAASKKIAFSYEFLDIYKAFADYYGQKNQVKKGEKYAALVFGEMLNQRQDSLVEYQKFEYARQYLFFAKEVVTKYEKEQKIARGSRLDQVTRYLAAIYAQQGKISKARRTLYDLYHNKALVDSLDAKQKAAFYSGIASTMLKAGIAEAKTLEIAKQAVKQEKNEQTLLTLGSVHAQQGRYKSAVALARQALDLAYSDFSFSIIGPKLEEWQKKAAGK